MSITALPTPPSRNDPTNFAERGDAFLAALPTFVTEANALEANVNAKEASATAAAQTATDKATAAATSETNAASNAGAAATSAANAGASAAAAATSESNAATSASQAAASAASIDPATIVRNTGNQTIGGIKTFSQTPVIPFVGAMRVSGLSGNVNATTPLTKFDLSCNFVTLRDANGATITLYGPHSRTVDLGLAGAIVNGRDQNLAFAANSWVHLYWIWNGATLGLIASLSATAPTLPTGYTHWCYATAIRWNGSSNIIPVFVRGANVRYDIDDGSVNRVLAGGLATTMTAVSCASLVPPNALRTQIFFIIFVSGQAVGTYDLIVRPTGSSKAGMLAARAAVQVANVVVEARSFVDFPLGTSQQLDYKLSVALTGNGAYVDVWGYVVPNGDA